MTIHSMRRTPRGEEMEMATLSDRLYAQARIVPIKTANRAKSIQKLADGGMEVMLHSGEALTLGPDDIELQAFVVYTMLNTDCHETAEESSAVAAAKPLRVVEVDLPKSGKHVQEWDGHVLVRVNGVDVRGAQ